MNDRGEPLIVCIGASAGGLASLQDFFRAVPPDSGIAFVLVQHLSPDHKSLMREILSKQTRIPIETAEDGQAVERDRIYLIPPTHNLTIEERTLRLSPRDTLQHLNYPIDIFLKSLAHDCGTDAVAIIMSGTGTDGTQGIRAIKQEGGIVLVQDESAEFDGMPRSAISTGLADIVASPAELATRVLELNARSAAPPDGTLDKILATLHERTGADFSEYRRKTIRRRLQNRMRICRVDTLEDYLTIFEGSDSEADALFRDITIGVTEFFRDKEAFDLLESTVIPKMIERAPSGTVLRVWIAGCSSGEEAYSIAMCLSDALLESPRDLTFKVFATDIDQEALHHGSAGVYAKSATENLSAQRRARYLVEEGDSVRVQRSLRQRIVFAMHNVAKDPPFTRIDLVVCRNLLIYQQPALQERVLSYLRFAMSDEGILFLGASEGLGIHASSFETISRRWRIFSRRALRSAPPTPALPSRPDTVPWRERQAAPSRAERKLQDRIAATLLAERGAAAVVLDDDHTVLHVYGETRGFLRVPEGAPTNRLEELLEREVHLATCELLRRLKREESDAVRCIARFQDTATDETLESELSLRAVPTGSDQTPVYVLTFGSRTQATGEEPPQVVQAGTSDGNRIEMLELELGETRERLNSTIEELESANQELQSTNEELIASNEELQSTNEELHSVNEELHTVNAEHQRRIHEQELIAGDLDHLLKTTDIGSIFLDEALNVRKFTPAVSNIIPLMTQDVGRPISHIRHEMPDIDLIAIARNVLESAETTETDVQMADGRCLLVRAIPYRDLDSRLSGIVMNFVDVTEIQRARESLMASEERFRQIAENISEILWSRDAEQREVQYVNAAFESVWQRPSIDVLRDSAVWLEPIHPDDRADVEAHYANLDGNEFDRSYRILREDGEVRWIRDRGFPIRDERGQVIRYAGIAEDITSNKRNEAALRDAAKSFEEIAIRDPLTGLVNRRGLERVLGRETARAGRDGGRLFGLLVDCDDFKQINDAHGHAFGDVVLAEVGRRLQGALRPTDCLARIGGDEFLALLPDTRMAEAYRVADRVRDAVTKRPVAQGSKEVGASVSIGVAEISPTASTTQEVVSSLHAALKQSKLGGKNRVASARGDADPTHHAADLERLRAGDGFRVVAQSIRRLEDGACVGHELLTRGPAGEWEQPADLFRASSYHGLLETVDLRCVRNCLEAAPDKGLGNVHVNLYPSTLMGLDGSRLADLFGALDGEATWCVELSEQQVVGDPARLRSRVAELQDLGVHVALDDIGFGRSSLEALIVLEPDVVKIDRAFVSGCADEPGKRRWLERLRNLAQTLSIKLIAEGIETEADLDALRTIGIPEGQGYFWDRPSAVVLGN